ncbi:MAG TPA: PBP1A family penicillin-binding protein [Bdellovibrionota bacterium]|nr:PBP1A family penicillin-binding protein [Bdellovibrionota bacterium]
MRPVQNARRLMVRIAIATTVVIFLYALYAAHLVSAKMSGARWKLPSRVYASPWILYPGSPLIEADLKDYFRRLGYARTERKPVAVGQWKKSSWSIEIGVRAFRDAVGEHPAQTLEIDLTGETIRSLQRKESDGRSEEIFTFTLEPEPVGEIFGAQREQRTVVRLNDLPSTMREAILLMEDRKFYEHHGISFRGIARAAWSNLQGGKVTQGGSTLTQQLMKNFFLSPERSLWRKIREAIFTVVVEILYSKDEIFEAYVNEIYLGQRGATSIHGYGEASRFYFSKQVAYLTLGEQALLVGLASSPGLYSPYTKPGAARERRALVLRALFENGKISKDLFAEADREPIEPRGKAGDERRAPYFMDYVKNEIGERYSSAQLAEEGYEIYTTLDPTFQASAEKAVSEGLAAVQAQGKRKKRKDVPPLGDKPLQAALIALHPQTGAIKAMIGGRSYEQTQFNRAVQSNRQPGSAVKPFVAATALMPDEGGEVPKATATTILDDRPATFSFSGKEWSPRNYEDVYAGSTTLRGAIERSLNVATINLAAGVGLERVAQFFQKVGFPKVAAVPSIVLGTMEVTPLQLARAYTVFANAGLRSDPQSVTAVVAQDGARLTQRSMEVERVLPLQIAYLVTNVLRGVIDRGTGYGARLAGLTGDLAGKTGTTDDYKDSWFIGYSPSLLAVVWVGLDDGTPTGLTGASGALPIWIRFMKEALRRLPREPFLIPPDIEWFTVDRMKGCVGGSGESLKEAFLKGTQPPRCK